MMSFGAVLILLIFGLPLLLIGGFFLIWALKVIKGDKDEQAEDARIIQEIHLGLDRMEKRIEALETILLEPEGKENRQ